MASIWTTIPAPPGTRFDLHLAEGLVGQEVTFRRDAAGMADVPARVLDARCAPLGTAIHLELAIVEPDPDAEAMAALIAGDTGLSGEVGPL